MDENDPRSHAGRAGHRSERAMGSRKGRTRARIITADLRVMGTPTRSRPLARSVAAHVVAFLFDNGLTDEWGERCDLHACHLDRLSLAPLNVNVKGRRRRPRQHATDLRRTRPPSLPPSLPVPPSDRIGVQSFSLVPLLDESGHCAVNVAVGRTDGRTSVGVSLSTNRINAGLSRGGHACNGTLQVGRARAWEWALLTFAATQPNICSQQPSSRDKVQQGQIEKIKIP